MRAYSGCVSSDTHLQQSYTPANTSWLLIEWVTEGSVLYPHSHAGSGLPGEQIKAAYTSLQNSTGCSCLIFKVLGCAGRQTRWLHGSFLVSTCFGWSSWCWLCCRGGWNCVGDCATPRRMPQTVPALLDRCHFTACWRHFLLFEMEFHPLVRSLLALLSFFQPLGGEESCFPFFIFL